MCVTWNAINALLQSDWSAQHSGLGHENLSRVPRRIFPRGFPPPTCHTRMRAHRKNTAGPARLLSVYIYSQTISNEAAFDSFSAKSVKKNIASKFALALSVLNQQNFRIQRSFFRPTTLAVRHYTCHALMSAGFFRIPPYCTQYPAYLEAKTAPP